MSDSIQFPDISRIWNSSVQGNNELVLEIFRFQYEYNPVYFKYCEHLKVNPLEVNKVQDIPFLPIEFFKSGKVLIGEPEIAFTSSGTGGEVSTHYVTQKSIYEASFLGAFKKYVGQPEEMIILCLLPSYLEREGSSLIYMAEHLVNLASPQSGFFLDNHNALHELLLKEKENGKKTLLLGVTFGLLDFAESFSVDFPELIVMETGGMKGRREEITREEVHSTLKAAFCVENIWSEYGMTELLSQAYSRGDGIFETPPWMDVVIRETNDPFAVSASKTGGINVIDLANIYSCSFIETQDLGRKTENGFEVLGRFDHSDVRGCNLMLSDY